MVEIIKEAVERYKPVKVLLLFSGGDDSLCSTHYSIKYLRSIGEDFIVYHGNTGIGIKETRSFVYETCERFDWKLYEGHPAKDETYEEMVKKYGFPGPFAHKYMYRNLKEKPLRRFISEKCKSSRRARENVLLVTGIRKSESRIRMCYTEYIKKVGSWIWCSPLFFWSKSNCDEYIEAWTYQKPCQAENLYFRRMSMWSICQT